jgi:hypothetical protein
VPVKVPEPIKPTPRSFKVSKEKLINYAGWYRNTRSGEGVKLYVQNEKLYVSRMGPITPVAENIFMTANSSIVEMNAKGVLVINSSRDSVYFNKVDSAKLDEKIMNEYVGEYYSDEAEAKFYVQVKNGKLVILQKPKTEFQLTPTYKDGFEIPVGTIYFDRDKNKVINFKVTVGRARHVEFKKIR